MKLLAIDQSTTDGSIAILRDNEILAEITWQETRGSGHRVFVALQQAVDQAGLSVAEIETFAVGLGPGTFSGLRISLSAAQAMALPSASPVYGLCSAEAISTRIAALRTADTVAVVGDARRGHLWLWTPAKPAPVLVTLEKLGSQLDGVACVATPDWDRIGEDLTRNLPAGVTAVQDISRPQASDVGRIVAGQIQGGNAQPAVSPIYLHPPVAVEPGSYRNKKGMT